MSLRARPGLLAAASVIALLAACSGPGPVLTPTPSATRTPTPTATASTPGYAAPAVDLCKSAAFDELATVLPVLGPLRPSNFGQRSFHCSTSAGVTDEFGASISIDTDIEREPAAAKITFEGMRGVRAKDLALIDIPDVGQGAYYTDDPLAGRLIAVYDGNLYLELTCKLLDSAAVVSPALADALLATARGTMANLRL